MQCIGRTKDRKRCRNSTKFLVCKKHIWQPLGLFISIITAVGFLAGFFHDLIKPINDTLNKNNELKKLVAIEIKSDRRRFADWEENVDPTQGKSDVLTILLDRQPVKSLEFYQTAKDQKFKNYPLTSRLAEHYIPTSAEYRVVDLDEDGINEIIIILTNQIYGFHYDKQINVLIYNPLGELLSHTPYPRDIPLLPLDVHSPYSAYKTTAVMKDEISGQVQSSTFCNGFEIVTIENKKSLQFSWVIDNAAYVDEHLHQVENFTYELGKLIPSDDEPSLYISASWETPKVGKKIENIQDAKKFLAERNLPPMNELINNANGKFK